MAEDDKRDHGDLSDEDVEARRVAELFFLAANSPRFLAAVTHPSFAHEEKGAQDNQRLEFLGDAILDFLVSDRLYAQFPEWDEGQLTRTRAQVVSTPALARFGREHQVAAALRFGKGAGQSSLDESENVLADAVEALLAATYLDNGFVQAKQVSDRLIDFGLACVSEAGARDAKSQLQEGGQAIGLKAPTYRVLRADGPAHETVFEVEVSVQGQPLAAGIGRSKRVAERDAARKALDEALFQDPSFRQSLRGEAT